MKDSVDDGAAQVADGAMSALVMVWEGGGRKRGGRGGMMVGSVAEEEWEGDGEGCHSCFTTAAAMVLVLPEASDR